ncbi:hypothetical protein ABID97_001943 [Variovorax sp. OAS795]|uniref:hypothetical protein n=1 Tax=Variovorax sp. OAS795 TaxID=3034231 RepID=UPI003392A633
MTTLQTINAAANWNLRVNENFKAVSPAASFGIKDSATTGLTLGYYGGIIDGVSYADGTHLLTASTTRYVVAARATGVVSSATGTTNWNDTTNYKRMGVAVVGASTITSWTDWREFSPGVGGAGVGDVVGPASAVNGRVATFNGVTGKLIQDGGTLLSDLATTAYVDGLLQGLSWKKAVRAATTVAGTLASSFENGDAIDGVTLATGDRVLIKNQVSTTENGIYTVNASGAPTRATDSDTGAEMVNATVFVSEGTTLADTQWTCSTNAPITIGSTSIAFVQLSAGGGAAWGSITGTLSSQTDLQAALDLKQVRSPSIQSVASSATVTPTFSNDMVKITAQAAGLTLANPTGTAIDGLGIVIRIKDNGTARSIAYGTQYRAIGVTLPTTTVISKTTYLAMVFNNDDTKWDVVAVGQEA